MPNRPPRRWSVAGSQVKRGDGFGIPSREVDGHDFFEVYEVAGETIERARAGDGPSLLHVKLNRYYGHFEGDAHDLPRAGRGRKRQGRDGRARHLPPARRRGLAPQAARSSTGSTGQVKSQIDTVMVDAKKAPHADRGRSDDRHLCQLLRGARDAEEKLSPGHQRGDAPGDGARRARHHHGRGHRRRHGHPGDHDAWGGPLGRHQGAEAAVRARAGARHAISPRSPSSARRRARRRRASAPSPS